MEIEKYADKIIKKLENIECDFIYIFGSYAKGEQNNDSDVDIAFYSLIKHDSYDIFLLAQEISLQLGKEVDLIQINFSTTVFQKEVVENGILIYEKNKIQREKFENLVLKKYLKLNEERKEIIDNYEV
ncbi:nucleotidyltransferase domain-containing protein [Fusobacterium sp. THCT13E1]|uniref:type VII toxin-antitoxin system MntA family adenylyltransferase antitoxin n=1 Tax=Fusobacterium ulcerans TaxID=861 RepID=UPI0010329C2C|nr:nucleotidyltransferase domain-containing protein [Fusobacterium ulcerans]